MITVNEKTLQSTEMDMEEAIKRFSKVVLTNEQVQDYAKQAVGRIDWENPALMHKGINWMAKRFLSKLES